MISAVADTVTDHKNIRRKGLRLHMDHLKWMGEAMAMVWSS